MIKFATILILIWLTGCATTSSHTPHHGVAEISTNVYALMDVDFRGLFGSQESLIERNIIFVDDFASSRGKVAVPIEARIHGVGFTGNLAWFYYKFSLENANPSKPPKKISDITIVRDERWAVDFYDSFAKQKAGREFDKLMELYELKKKGAISEVEYEQQKTKMLNGI